MKTLLTYRVPNIHGNKVVVVGSKISQGLNDALEAIAQTHDRSMSYVLRELAVRGLARYYADGHIRITPEEEAAIASGKPGGGVLDALHTAKGKIRGAAVDRDFGQTLTDETADVSAKPKKKTK